MNKPHSFRKKPVVIEAVQFVGHNSAAIAAFTDGAARYSSTRCGDVETNCHLIIPTLEGDHKADVGDWIIKELSETWRHVTADGRVQVIVVELSLEEYV